MASQTCTSFSLIKISYVEGFPKFLTYLHVAVSTYKSSLSREFPPTLQQAIARHDDQQPFTLVIAQEREKTASFHACPASHHVTSIGEQQTATDSSHSTHLMQATAQAVDGGQSKLLQPTRRKHCTYTTTSSSPLVYIVALTASSILSHHQCPITTNLFHQHHETSHPHLMVSSLCFCRLK
ncbi:hypothetical protein I3842_05G161100 [Carya illinoinensis]|uniref:Uncharacterized protein n=1 Tax=Carya illinoinensis TaxID=32201 RepID=A0A922F3Q4_CARIL|nr:hypothetical protein I3842_05G161100 [Carya illinoinensis]